MTVKGHKVPKKTIKSVIEKTVYPAILSFKNEGETNEGEITTFPDKQNRKAIASRSALPEI